MLRMMFGEPKRIDDGLLKEAFDTIRAYAGRLNRRQKRGELDAASAGQLAIYADSFIDSLDELEQSVYCCRRFGGMVRSHYEREMNEGERDAYHRYVYFYKNSFLRVFSMLDKLGFFLNEALELRTEQIKSRFSYFTVLRRMQEHKFHSRLAAALYELKEKHRDSLDKLRSERNLETHAMNAEVWDNLKHAMKTGSRHTPIENIPGNVRNVELGFEMVCRALIASFSYLR